MTTVHRRLISGERIELHQLRAPVNDEAHAKLLKKAGKLAVTLEADAITLDGIHWEDGDRAGQAFFVLNVFAHYVDAW